MRARVKQLLDQAPLQLKLAIALQAFSGLRPSDVYDLTFEDFEPDFSEGVIPVCLFVKARKHRGDHSSPLCARAGCILIARLETSAGLSLNCIQTRNFLRHPEHIIDETATIPGVDIEELYEVCDV